MTPAMEDVVAIRLDLNVGGTAYLMTWGRIPEAVDVKPLEEMALAAAPSFALGGGRAIKATVCMTLGEAVDEPYFYEALIHFGQRSIPFGDGYAAWRSERLEELRSGKGFYFLGRKARDNR